MIYLTGYDKIVIVIIAFAFICHFATAVGIEYYRTVGQVQAAADVLEGNAMARLFFELNALGTIIRIILFGTIFGGYFAYFRKFQFTPQRDAFAFTVTTIFFTCLYMVVNDLGHLVGLFL